MLFCCGTHILIYKCKWNCSTAITRHNWTVRWVFFSMISEMFCTYVWTFRRLKRQGFILQGKLSTWKTSPPDLFLLVLLSFLCPVTEVATGCRKTLWFSLLPSEMCALLHQLLQTRCCRWGRSGSLWLVWLIIQLIGSFGAALVKHAGMRFSNLCSFQTEDGTAEALYASCDLISGGPGLRNEIWFQRLIDEEKYNSGRKPASME